MQSSELSHLEIYEVVYKVEIQFSHKGQSPALIFNIRGKKEEKGES